MSQPSCSSGRGRVRQCRKLLQRCGEWSQTGLGPRDPWPGAAVSAVPLPPVGPTPLLGSLVWEGVAEEEVQAGRGVGVEDACVHPPQYLATKLSPGVPPYFPNFENFHGPLQPPLRLQSPLFLQACVEGLGLFFPLRLKFCDGFPPISLNVKNSWPVAASAGTPVPSLPSLAPPVPVGVRGGVRHLRLLRTVFLPGVPP